MLLRVAYHESVHTGQLLDYLRTAGVPRELIWDSAARVMTTWQKGG